MKKSRLLVDELPIELPDDSNLPLGHGEGQGKLLERDQKSSLSPFSVPGHFVVDAQKFRFRSLLFDL